MHEIELRQFVGQGYKIETGLDNTRKEKAKE
jgi:hypothetical protein